MLVSKWRRSLGRETRHSDRYTEEHLRQVRGGLDRKRQTDKGRDREMEAESTGKETQETDEAS